MPRKVTIFQTLDDKGNPDDVHRDGPYICRWENAWLGHGYYFWEIFLNSAQWWGKSRYKDNYIICEGNYIFDDEKIFDLSNGNPQHNLDFETYLKELKSKGFIKEKVTTVSRVFIFLKTHIKSFSKYEASRAYSPNAIGTNYPEHIHRLYFEKDKDMYYDMRPAVQICFYSKKALSLSDYRIIYPEHYIDNGVF